MFDGAGGGTIEWECRSEKDYPKVDRLYNDFDAPFDLSDYVYDMPGKAYWKTIRTERFNGDRLNWFGEFVLADNV